MESAIWSSVYLQLRNKKAAFKRRPFYLNPNLKTTVKQEFKFRSKAHIAQLNFYTLKYTRLTKQQLEELHQEFINFLATQSITSQEWTTLKQEKPHVAEEEIDVFSDLVWEGVLSKVSYLENISTRQMHLFHLTEKEMKLVSIKVMNPEVDLQTTLGFTWFKKNWQSDFVEYLTASKAYTEDKNLDKFKLIQQGAVITQGELHQWFDKIIE